MQKLIPLSYFAGFHPISGSALISDEYLDWIDKAYSLVVTIEASKLEKGVPVKWKVSYHNETLNKETVDFDYESIPSERTEEYLSQTRFNTPEEALECFNEFVEKVKKEYPYVWKIENGKAVIREIAT